MQHVSVELEQSWARAWSGVAALGDGLAVRDDLLARYALPQRAYHTVQHLCECISTFSEVAAGAEHPAAVELALWFHDAVYDESGLNEERSADLAMVAMRSAKAPEEMIALVQSLVLMTCHTACPVSADEMVIVDVDLSILGATADRFALYEKQIRQEYEHVPEDQFRVGRRTVLESFLNRPRIYSTNVMFYRFEIPARVNLIRAIQTLDGISGQRLKFAATKAEASSDGRVMVGLFKGSSRRLESSLAGMDLVVLPMLACAARPGDLVSDFAIYANPESLDQRFWGALGDAFVSGAEDGKH